MKYQCAIRIDKPLATVWEFLINPDNLRLWSQGFETWELLSGEPGTVGARYKITYRENGKDTVFTDELLELAEHQSVRASKRHETMYITLFNRFIDHEGSSTEIVSDVEVQFLTALFKTLGPGLKGEFVKRQNNDFATLKQVLESSP